MVAVLFAGRGDSDSISSSALSFRFGLPWRFGLGVRRGLCRRGLRARESVVGRVFTESRKRSASETGPLMTVTRFIEGS